jgi:hypothetical protein
MSGLTLAQHFYRAKAIMFYNRSNGVPLAYCNELQDCKCDDKITWDHLKVAGRIVDSAVKERSIELQFTANNYIPGQITLFTNGLNTPVVANAAGQVLNIGNIQGTSAYGPITGVSGITIGTGGNLKEGLYVAKATAAKVLSIYAYSDLYLKNGSGNNEAFIDDTCAIETGITLSNGAPTSVVGLGLVFTGGSAMAMVVGDSFEFQVVEQNRQGFQIDVDDNIDFSDVGAVVWPMPHDKHFSYIRLYRCKVAGMPYDLKDGFSSYQITSQVLFDDAVSRYYRIYRSWI